MHTLHKNFKIILNLVSAAELQVDSDPHFLLVGDCWR
jgi:hypothetical protein